ncbi:MAG: hypothetical protein ACQEW5_29225 [Bacillota bacterium]
MGKKLVVIGVMLSLSLCFVGDKYYASTLANKNQSNIEKLFESNAYDEANERYGIYNMGVGKSEKILSVGLHDTKNKKEVQQYFEEYLSNIGVEDYKVEVLVR